MQTTADVKAQLDAIATYLGKTFPTTSIERYHDPARNTVGFRFSGKSHGNVEFGSAFLTSLPRDEAGVALELHLRHAGAEIIETRSDQCLVFTQTGLTREATVNMEV